MAQIKELDLGSSDFKDIIQNNNYFVDKTLFIKEVIKAQKKVLLLPRPRRFGKTLNLSMLRYFFDKNQPENKKLFKDLKIWQTDDDIKQHCCKYPVIYITFKDAKADTWKGCYQHITDDISKLYQQHNYLLEHNLLNEKETIDFNNIINETANETKFAKSLQNLSYYLQRYHNEKVVLLIDEYDTPIQVGYNKFYNEVISFMRSLLSGAFKDNINIYKGIITGILKVSKESIFSGLNNIDTYSVFNYDFADKFGFTEDEIDKILKDFKLKDKQDQVKKWYNGYKFGQTENIYNPWSILSYVTKHKEGLQPFWTKTSTNDLIKNEIKKKDAQEIRKDILKLINQQSIEKDIEENFVFPNINTRKDLLWSLLIYSGYLTSVKKISRKKYELTIPNYELKTVFQDTIIEWLSVDIKIQKTLLENTTSYLINNEISKFEKGFKEIIGDTFSYYDTAKNHEYVYHSYILGLLAIIGDDYIIKSNKESGEGRYDIMLIPRRHAPLQSGVVIEIKQINKQQENENKTVFFKRINKQIKLATNQIDRNKYYKELIDNKIKQDKIIKIPIIFAGKEPYIILKETE